LCVTVDEARGWVSRLAGIFAVRTDVTLEIANEPQFNGVDPADFMSTSTAGVLTASGNYDVDYSGSMTTLPNVRDYVTVHSERGDEWPRKFKDPAREFGVTGFDANGVHFNALHKPIVGDEPMGAGEVDQYGRRSTVARDFRDYGAVCGLFAAGCTFHFEGGLTARLPGPIEEAAGRVFFAGMDAIPLDAPTWTYTAGHLGDCPLEFDTTKALRTFCMMNGSQATCVIVRKNYDQPVAKNGWTISGYGSDDKAIVFLTR
jgi:hypothetical protein